MNGTTTESVDSAAIAVLVGAIGKRMDRPAELRSVEGGWAIAFVGSAPNLELIGRTQYSAVLHAARFYLRSDCYSGGRAEEQVQRTARDILAGRPLPPRKRGSYPREDRPVKAVKKRRKRRKKCPTCGRLR